MTTKKFPKVIIVEGIDRIGKDTLISNLRKWYFENRNQSSIHMHYSSPPFVDNQFHYQYESYKTGFNMIGQYVDDAQESSILFINRFHLGETVYGPRYRNISPNEINQIFNLESTFLTYADLREYNPKDILLILLTTSSFNHIKDDGKNFDFTKKSEEQNDFIKAYNRSNINKIRIDTYDPNIKTYRNDISILHNVLDKL